MGGLFNDQQAAIPIDLEDADIVLYPDFFSLDQADRYFNLLQNELAWSQQSIQLYGRAVAVPRLSAWYADQGKSYQYSGLKSQGLAWTNTLSSLRNVVSEHCQCGFNSVLANLYRDQSDSVAWHADDEPELGLNPTIASVSLGYERKFMLKHKTKPIKKSFLLPHGSLLIMRGQTQHNWLHQIAKSKKVMAARINLTFRVVS